MPANLATFIMTHSWVIIAVVIWTLLWKGVALWKAARNTSYAWFVILLIINTLGILEIIYIFGFSRKKFQPQAYRMNGGNNIEKRILDIKG